MATRKGILETQLCKDTAQRAIHNASVYWEDLDWLNGDEGPDITAKDLLKEAFPWSWSPEGQKYWQDIVNE